jgi:hypothetical protein
MARKNTKIVGKHNFGCLEDIRAFVALTAGLPGDTLFHTTETDKVEVTNYGTHHAIAVVKTDAYRPTNGW